MIPQFALADHVFVCVQGGHVVFLDVRKDRYFALDAAKTANLAALVPGWPVREPGSAQDTPGLAALPSNALELLVQRGLLLAGGRVAGKAATPVVAMSPESEITSDEDDAPVKQSCAGIAAFVRSAVLASAMLKFRSFERVVQRARRRRARAGARADHLDPEQARRAIALFTSLRPFFFSGKDECLFEAFALGEFLARYAVFPSWVFGVQARPFAAHCWLQHGGIVLNDTVEHVTRYTPIMCI